MSTGGPKRCAGARRLQLIAGLVAGAALILLASCTPADQDEQAVLATVNGRDITLGDLLAELRRTRGPSTLVELLDTHLILSAAAKANLSIADGEMRLRLERAVSEVGSDRDFQDRLESFGTTREQFTERLRVDLLLDKLARADMQTNEQEIKDFYREHEEEFRLGERVQARMMLFAGQADAEAVYEMLQQPEADFAGLAKALSTDPATKDQGGDMGYFERADYAKEISEVAFSLQVGQTSRVFRAPDGYCILKVEDRKPPGVTPLSEVEEQIKARVTAAKLPSARSEWVLKARQQATIEIPDEELRKATLELLKHAPTPQPVSLMPMLMP